MSYEPGLIDELAKRSDFEQIFRLIDLLIHLSPRDKGGKQQRHARKELRERLGEQAYNEICAVFML